MGYIDDETLREAHGWTNNPPNITVGPPGLNAIAKATRANAKDKGWSRPGDATPDVMRKMTGLSMLIRNVACEMEQVRKGRPYHSGMSRYDWAEAEGAAEKIDPENHRALTALGLIVTEVVEGMDAVTGGNGPSEHCPEMSALEEELADVIIRALDMFEDMGWDADRAVRLKMEFNRTRPVKHGGKTC